MENSFTNKRLKKIVNVYQLEYKNNKSPGLGDFLRGCFAMRQLSTLLNIDFDLDISQHPIAKYFENPTPVPGVQYNNIEFYLDLNKSNVEICFETRTTNVNKSFLINIINHLNNQNTEVFGIFSNAYPLYNYYKPEGIKFIRSKLRPNQEMKKYVQETLNTLGLSKKGYSVIHIRLGDKYLVQGENLSLSYQEKIKNMILEKVDPNKKYLIISDCNALKRCLKYISNFYLLVKEIEHLGGNGLKQKSSESVGIKNTLLDFFLMEESQSVISYSVYGHVSGFSKYCCVLNNIPFQYVKI
jgi:hypothetical protein